MTAKTMLLMTDIAEDIGLNAYKIVKHANEEDDSYALIQDSVYGGCGYKDIIKRST